MEELTKPVNELSNTIDLESTLIRAEALFRRFQRLVEAIDKKSNFPAPALRQRGGIRNIPVTDGKSSPSSPSEGRANTSAVDAVTVGSTNSGPGKSDGAKQSNNSKDDGKGSKGKDSNDKGKGAEELADQRPKVISPELRALLSRKVEVLPKKVVKNESDGSASAGRK